MQHYEVSANVLSAIVNLVTGSRHALLVLVMASGFRFKAWENKNDSTVTFQDVDSCFWKRFFRLVSAAVCSPAHGMLALV